MINHGLRTPNEGINQRNLKYAKYASGVPKNLGLGFVFRPCSEGVISSPGVHSPCNQSKVWDYEGKKINVFGPSN